MGKMTPTAEWPRRVLATFFVSAAAVALSAFVLGSHAGPAEAAFDESWASPSEAQSVLNFEFYRENIEPIFVRGHGENGPGPGRVCHVSFMAGWDSL